AWGTPDGAPGVAATKAFNKQPATVGNGVMVALAASDKEQVARLHEIALSHGGSDEGAPGPRGGGFYAAYFRDPDGNKLNAFVMES
ncbi:MAG: VOC family protein, partial [Pseudomonadota bacterium]